MRGGEKGNNNSEKIKKNKNEKFKILIVGLFIHSNNFNNFLVIFFR